jgi:opacity protein-like surface antigen
MSIFAVRSGLVFAVAALCVGGGPAHAQAAPVMYWTPGWLGFGGNLNAGQDANTEDNFAAFGGSDAGGVSRTRYNFPNGWFVGSDRGGIGLGGSGLSGINQAGAFGSFHSESMQFGYNFKNAPVTFFGGLDTLKYNSGIGSAFSPFDATTSTVPGYRAHAGVEFKPTSNLSLSLGVGYTQQSGRIDTDTKSPSLSNASQFDLVGGRR